MFDISLPRPVAGQQPLGMQVHHHRLQLAQGGAGIGKHHLQIFTHLLKAAVPIEQPQHMVVFRIQPVILQRHRILDDEILPSLALHTLRNEIRPPHQRNGSSQ
jgi:hypothetical protein